MTSEKKAALDATIALVSAYVSAEKGIHRLSMDDKMDYPEAYANFIETVYKKVESLIKYSESV